MPTHPDAAIQALLDKQALTELVTAYCAAADRRDYERLSSLYHWDAIDDHGSFSSGPVSQLVSAMTDAAVFVDTLHHNVTTTNFVIEGDLAEGEIYVIAFHRASVGARSFDLLVGGRYLDKYERRDGTWKISHRTIVTDWACPAEPSQVDLSHPMVVGGRVGRPDASDPSYAFFSLIRRGVS